jgi:hypothetical protein
MLVQDNNFWVWLAGFIDGEGIHVNNRARYSLERPRHPGIHCREDWEGKIQKSGSYFPPKLYSNMLRAILPKLVTYLVMRRRHAELLQKALSHIEYRKHRDDRTDEILEYLSIQLKSLRQMSSAEHSGCSLTIWNSSVFTGQPTQYRTSKLSKYLGTAAHDSRMGWEDLATRMVR